MHAGEQGIKPDFAQLISNVLEPAKLDSDPAEILSRLLDQLISLGQTAQQLRRVLSGNGHRHKKLSEVVQQLIEGGEHAP